MGGGQFTSNLQEVSTADRDPEGLRTKALLGDGQLVESGLDGSETCFRCVQERSAAPFVITTSAAVMINNTVWQAYGKIIARPPSGVMSSVIGRLAVACSRTTRSRLPSVPLYSQVSSTDIATTEITKIGKSASGSNSTR